MRRKASREAIIEAEKEYSYISQRTHLDVRHERPWREKEEPEHAREEMKAECYNCLSTVAVDVEKTRENQYWQCSRCAALNCAEMKHKAHPNLFCNFEKRSNLRLEFQAALNQEIISCPYCFHLQVKKLDEACQHCEHKFCQECSAKIPPIEVHGLQYHRRHCKHFIESTYTGLKLNPHCPECVRAKGLCAPPKERQEWDVPIEEIDF